MYSNPCRPSRPSGSKESKGVAAAPAREITGRSKCSLLLSIHSRYQTTGCFVRWLTPALTPAQGQAQGRPLARRSRVCAPLAGCGPDVAVLHGQADHRWMDPSAYEPEDPGPEPPVVPSPGGWAVPQGRLAAWNWTPPAGARPRPDRMPLWVRIWYRTPLIDRYAYAWMWFGGGWDVGPADSLRDSA